MPPAQKPQVGGDVQDLPLGPRRVTGIQGRPVSTQAPTKNQALEWNGSLWVPTTVSAATSPLTTKGDIWGYSSVDARIPVGSDGNVLTADSTQTLGVKWAAGGSGTPTDGWVDDTAETWTFVSSTSFKITGSNVTAKYTPGTRIKLTQTTVKYFIVTSSSFSSDTTVNITGGTDYTLANAAISANFHSYMANPQGYPGWFNFAPALTGFSGSPTSVARFNVVGRVCAAYLDFNGTSNATSLGFTLPMAVNSGNSDGGYYLLGFAEDNGTVQTSPCLVALPASGTSATVVKNPSSTAWTGSGTKRVFGLFTYDV